MRTQNLFRYHFHFPSVVSFQSPPQEDFSEEREGDAGRVDFGGAGGLSGRMGGGGFRGALVMEPQPEGAGG